MALDQSSNFVGLFTNPSALAVPEGALSKADDVVISRPGIVEMRPGFELVTNTLANLDRLIYRDTSSKVTLAHRSTDNAYGHVGSVFTSLATVTPFEFLHSVEAGSNLYLTSNTGVLRHSGTDPRATVPVKAGVPQGLLGWAKGGTPGSGTAVEADSQVAYRVVWFEEDPSGASHIGAPSGRVVFVNQAITLPAGKLAIAGGTTLTVIADDGHPFNVGDKITAAAINGTGTLNGNYTVTATTANTITATSSDSHTEDTSLAYRLGFAARDTTVQVIIPDGLRAGSWFQLYRSEGSVDSETPPEDELFLVYESEPISSSALITITDVTPDGLLGAALYTNFNSGEGIAQAANEPPVAGDIAHFKGYTFYANTITPHRAPFQLVSVPAQNDTINLIGGGAGSRTVSALTRSNTLVTATTTAAHGYQPGQEVNLTGGATNQALISATGSSALHISPDGATASYAFPTTGLTHIAYNGTYFVAAGTEGATHKAYYSTDAKTWSPGYPYLGTIGGAIIGLKWSASLGAFYAMTSNGGVGITPYGGPWTGLPACGLPSVQDFAIHNNTIVAVGGMSVSGIDTAGSAVSTDGGYTWTVGTMYPLEGQWESVVWDEPTQRWVAVGYTGEAVRSSDGLTWTFHTMPAGFYTSVTTNGSRLVAVGDHFATSDDGGQTWTQRTMPNSSIHWSVLWDGSQFVATALDKIAKSTDGVTWVASTVTGIGTVGAPISIGVSFSSGIKTVVSAPSATTFTYNEAGADAGISGLSIIALPVTPSFPNLMLTATTANTDTSTDGTFTIYSDGLPGLNIQRTAESLVAALNRMTTNTVCKAFYVSGPDDVPGKIIIESAASTDPVYGSFLVSSTRILPNTVTSTQDVWPNGLYYSKLQQAEAVPLFNNKRIGGATKKILRILALQNALLILKEDGIYKLTGTVAPFNVDPVDETLRVIAPESAVVMNNRVYVLTDQGVAEVTEQGADIKSFPVDDFFRPFLTEAGRAALYKYAYGIAAAPLHKYILFFPQVTSDTQAKQALVYDYATQAWTRWVISTRHGIVNPADHRIYLAGDNGVLRELRNNSRTDFHDVLATGVTTAIPASVELKKLVGGPNGKFQYVHFHFREAHFTTATASFETDLSPAVETRSIDGATYGLSAVSDAKPVRIRLRVPRNATRGTEIKIGFSQAVADAPFALEQMVLVAQAGQK